MPSIRQANITYNGSDHISSSFDNDEDIIATVEIVAIIDRQDDPLDRQDNLAVRQDNIAVRQDNPPILFCLIRGGDSILLTPTGQAGVYRGATLGPVHIVFRPDEIEWGRSPVKQSEYVVGVYKDLGCTIEVAATTYVALHFA